MKSSLLIALALAALLISGCVETRPRALPGSTSAVLPAPEGKNGKRQPAEVSPERRAEALARFATGISYELNDQPELALEQFRQATFADPYNEQLALELGQRFVQIKQPDRAVEVLTNAAKHSPSSGSIFAQLAQAHLLTGNSNQAISAAQSAIKKSPDSISGYQILTGIFLQNARTNEALQILKNASRRQSDDILFLVPLADLYSRLTLVSPEETKLVQKSGLNVLDRAADLNPTNPNLRQKMAEIYSNLGDAEKAAKIYLSLLQEFEEIPMMRDALRERLTNLYLRHENTSHAVEQLEAIARDNPTRYPQAWYLLGTFASDAKDYAKAEDYFNRALLISPEMERVYYDLAGMQMDMGQPGEALTTLERARTRFPNNFTLEFYTGLAYSRMKNFTGAIKHFSAAEMIGKTSDPRRINHLFFFQVGIAFERNQDFVQAADYFKKCLELNPNFSDALNYLGYMWADRGEHLLEAKTLIEKAVTIEPENAAYLDSLGWVLFKLSDPQSALTHLLKAAELAEEPDAVIYDHLGDVYHALGQNGKAQEAWQKSIGLEPNDTVKQKIETQSSL